MVQVEHEDAWSTLGRACQILDNLIAQGKAKRMIVVMTNGNFYQAAVPGEAPENANKPAPSFGGPGKCLGFLPEPAAIRTSQEGPARAGAHGVREQRYGREGAGLRRGGMPFQADSASNAEGGGADGGARTGRDSGAAPVGQSGDGKAQNAAESL